MAKQRKSTRTGSGKKFTLPRISFLHVMYLIMAIATVFSLFAGIFGTTSSPAPSSTVTSQASDKVNGPRIPITVTPVSPTAGPTSTTP